MSDAALDSGAQSQDARAVPRILLVEDNEMNADMLSRRLRRRGYEVEVAGDGEAAVRRARETLPDVILMDVSLPLLDGWAATRILKGEAPTAAIPIVALTAHALASDRDQSLEAGCDDFDTKPVDIERLLSKIERVLEASQTER